LLVELIVNRVPQTFAAPVTLGPDVFSGKPFEYRQRFPGCAVGLALVPPVQPAGTDAGPGT
jgi:hypothetical protein